MLGTSNLFDWNLPIYPENGSDLNPLLQDFGLIVHPHALYGYVGFAVLACDRDAFPSGDRQRIGGGRACGRTPPGVSDDGITLYSWWATTNWVGAAGGSGMRWKTRCAPARRDRTHPLFAASEKRGVQELDRAAGHRGVLAVAAWRVSGPLGVLTSVHALRSIRSAACWSSSRSWSGLRLLCTRCAPGGSRATSSCNVGA